MMNVLDPWGGFGKACHLHGLFKPVLVGLLLFLLHNVFVGHCTSKIQIDLVPQGCDLWRFDWYRFACPLKVDEKALQSTQQYKTVNV
jgi:hypothetical protein